MEHKSKETWQSLRDRIFNAHQMHSQPRKPIYITDNGLGFYLPQMTVYSSNYPGRLKDTTAWPLNLKSPVPEWLC